jgi:hypothetical protein
MESEGKLDEALALYQRIKEEYSTTNEGRNVEKYIARVEIKQNN